MPIASFVRAGSYALWTARLQLLRRRQVSYCQCFTPHVACLENRRYYREIYYGLRIYERLRIAIGPNKGLWASKHITSTMSEAAVAPPAEDAPTSVANKEQRANPELVKAPLRPVIYRGPMSETLRKVKILSLTTLVLSAATAPLLIFFASPQLTSVLKGSAAAVVTALSMSTTAALHWFVGPYVHKMTWNPGEQEIEVEVVTWMATYERRKFNISDVGPAKSNRPFVTFAAKGKLYFVDPDKMNRDLYKMLTTFKNKK